MPDIFGELFSKMNTKQFAYYLGSTLFPGEAHLTKIFENTHIEVKFSDVLFIYLKHLYVPASLWKEFPNQCKIGNNVKSLSISALRYPDTMVEALSGNTSLQKLQLSFPKSEESDFKAMFQTISELPQLSEVKFVNIIGMIPLLGEFLKNSKASTIRVKQQCLGDLDCEPIIIALGNSNHISNLSLELFQFKKNSAEKWREAFSKNKSLTSLQLIEGEFIGESCFNDFLGSLFLAENLTSLSLKYYFPDFVSCTETSADLLCEFISKNTLKELSLDFVDKLTLQMSCKILLAVKANTSINVLKLTNFLEPDAVSIFCDILAQHTNLTNLEFGPHRSDVMMSRETCNKIKNQLKNNTTITSIVLHHTDTPCTFLWDLLPRNILTSITLGHNWELPSFTFSDLEVIFWNYSLTNMYVPQSSTRGHQAIAVHIAANEGIINLKDLI